MDFKKLTQLLQRGAGNTNPDSPLPDSSEKIYVSPLALLKMLKHSRAGVPMEVMGLMLGEFVDDYTVNVIDVFAMPQSGTSVSVESVDPVFQTDMLNMLKQTGRSEMVIGWYHSHPGFGCWLSSVDVNTHQSFESLNSRAVALVIDPIQSVRGKVVADAFRLIGNYRMIPDQDFREHTSSEGFLNRPTIQALIHGLNKSYYSLNIKYRKTKTQQRALLQFGSNGKNEEEFKVESHDELMRFNENALKKSLKLADQINSQLDFQRGKSRDEEEMDRVGVEDPVVRLKELIDELVLKNGKQCRGLVTNSVVFN